MEDFELRHKQLQVELADNNRKLLEAQIAFVKDVPAFVSDAANYEKIFLVISALPPIFWERKDLAELVGIAMDSLPFELQKKCISHWSCMSAEEQEDVNEEIRLMEEKFASDADEFIRIEMSKVSPDGYKGDFLDGHWLQVNSSMDSPHDIAEAFSRLAELLVAAEAAGPAMDLLLAVGADQGITEMTMFRRLQINATIVRWALRLGPDTTADRDELIDVGALLIEWARRWLTQGLTH
jgi:hypothetical protein